MIVIINLTALFFISESSITVTIILFHPIRKYNQMSCMVEREQNDLRYSGTIGIKKIG